METYDNEHEQVEALKAWWDKNGTRTIIAIVIVLAGVLGWRTWLDRSHREAEAASEQYMKMLEVVKSKPEQALEIGQQLVGSHAGSSYAAMASLVMASIAVEQNDQAAATAQLRWVLEKSKVEELREVARLRLGRLLLDSGKADEALALLAKGESASFRAPHDELRGDILLSQGKRAEARTAYANALAGYASVPAKQNLLQMKIDDLADAKGSDS
ncbi:MAG TPA: tetratricopeptide repeat protein [Gammaproteobacteria bacterium]